MRPTLFRLASDTEDNDDALGELQPHVHVKGVAPTKAFDLSAFTADILQANDSLTHIIHVYRLLVEGQEESAEEATTQQPSGC